MTLSVLGSGWDLTLAGRIRIDQVFGKSIKYFIAMKNLVFARACVHYIYMCVRLCPIFKIKYMIHIRDIIRLFFYISCIKTWINILSFRVQFRYEFKYFGFVFKFVSVQTGFGLALKKTFGFDLVITRL